MQSVYRFASLEREEGEKRERNGTEKGKMVEKGKRRSSEVLGVKAFVCRL